MLARAMGIVAAVVLIPATVNAFDHDHHFHHDDSGSGCSSSSSSPPDEVDAPPAPPISASTTNVIFVTSTTFSGAVGGLSAADSYCQSSAANAGLAGEFRAWMSDDTTNAYDRINDVGPWYSTANQLAFSSKADLLGGSQSDLTDEFGGLSTGAAWTGSNAAGNASGADCHGWTYAIHDATATTGDTRGNDAQWGGDAAAIACDSKASLICVQQ